MEHPTVALLKTTFADFQRHKSQWLAAAIAYFTLFATAPLIIVVVEIAGLFLGQHRAALGRLYAYMSVTAGQAATPVIKAIVAATFSQPRNNMLAQIIAWIVFVVAAVGLFSSLQDALNTVWDVAPGARTLAQTARERLVSFAAVLAMALLLLVALAVNAGLTIASAALLHVVPGFPTIAKTLDLAATFAMTTLLFAVLFVLLPDCRVAWRDVWLGAFVSAGLFVAGQFVLGWYLGRVAITSAYGTFGGLIAFLIWTYYSAQILLIGAEFTHVYAQRYGSLKLPND